MNTGYIEKSNPSRYPILIAVILGNIMGPINTNVVNVTLPTIAEYYHVELSVAQWVPMTFLLTISSLLLFYGRLGDILGYKRLFLAGLAGFNIASVLCAVSYFLPTIYWLIFFRAIQGIMAGMMIAVATAILTATFPANERGKALGLNAIGISAGMAIGPSLGGIITYWLGWPFIFLINVPIGIAAFIWSRHIIPEIKGQPGKMDISGALTSVIALLAFLLFINYVPGNGFSPYSITLLAITIVATTSFIWIEKKADSPMLTLSLFNNLTFSFGNISGLLNFMSQYIMAFITPFYLQRLLHYSTMDVGLTMTAFPLTVMAIAPFSGALSDRLGTRALSFLGAGLCAVGLFLMNQLPVSASSFDVAWRMAVFGLGTGIFQSPNNSAVMGSAPRPLLGSASGVLSMVRNLGMVLGIATGGAVLSAFVSSGTLQQPLLFDAQAAEFLFGLQQAYLVGAVLTAIAAVTSLVRFR